MDVIVVGLGSMGAATTYQLASRGVRVLGLDRFTPPHGRGAHAGGSRIIRLAYAEGAEYVPLLRRAYELWTALGELAGVPVMTTTGGLMIGTPDSELVAGALASARTHGLRHELLDAAEVRRRFPMFGPTDREVALYEEVAGVLRPEAAIAGYLRLARRAGAELRYGVRVTGWRATGSGVEVDTAGGTLSAGRLVLTPGAWAPDLLADLQAPLVVQRRVQHYWRPPSDEFALGRLPIWVWEYQPGMAAYGLPAVAPWPEPAGALPPEGAVGPGGQGTGRVADSTGQGTDSATADPTGGVKAALHHGADPADPDAGAAAATSEEVTAMRAWLRTRIPALAESDWLGAKPCLYTLTADEHFLLGGHPRHPTVAVAGGFSGHGFKFAPVVGEILADIVTSGGTAHPIGLFAPDRFARAAGG